MSNTTCNRVIAPWVTDEDRQQIANTIAYARDAYHAQKGDRS